MLSFGMNDAIVVDTNVVVSALLNPDTAPRAVLRACLAKSVKPLMGNALFAEYGSVIGRESIFANSPLSLDERQAFLDDFFSVCDWVSVYYDPTCPMRQTTTFWNWQWRAGLGQLSPAIQQTSNEPLCGFRISKLCHHGNL